MFTEEAGNQICNLSVVDRISASGCSINLLLLFMLVLSQQFDKLIQTAATTSSNILKNLPQICLTGSW